MSENIVFTLDGAAITAAEPMKQPYFSRVPKSSGRSPRPAGKMPPEAPPGR